MTDSVVTPSSASPGEPRPARDVCDLNPDGDEHVPGLGRDRDECRHCDADVRVRPASEAVDAELLLALSRARRCVRNPFAYSGLPARYVAPVLAELDRLREQRDAVLALCDKSDAMYEAGDDGWGYAHFNADVPQWVARVRRALGVSE